MKITKTGLTMTIEFKNSKELKILNISAEKIAEVISHGYGKVTIRIKDKNTALVEGGTSKIIN